MPRFFSVSHNSTYTRGYPWLTTLKEGFGAVYHCGTCGRVLHYATGEMAAVLEPHKGTQWADVLGCGHFPFFIVSERVLECWEQEAVGSFPGAEVRLLPPIPKKLGDKPAPRYYWIDGTKMRGALVDFDASGFVDVKFCPSVVSEATMSPQPIRTSIEAADGLPTSSATTPGTV